MRNGRRFTGPAYAKGYSASGASSARQVPAGNANEPSAWGVDVAARCHRVRRGADASLSVGFWCSLFVEIIGGLVTAVALGIGAAIFAASQQVRSHDERIDDLYEDNRRWFRDRDGRVEIEKRRAIGDMNSRGLASSGAWLQAMAIKQQDALHDYRDEMSAKRRRYRELRDPEGKPHELVRMRRSKSMRRFELTDEQHAILAKWRANIRPAHMPDDDQAIDDPTSEELEPELRRFERDGDPPLSDERASPG
ncbi:MAG: hypothetical protein ACXVHB_28840 [Solirubrobacteraceae bacterium]